MNKETFEALLDVVAYLELAKANKQLTAVLEQELEQVLAWIDEVAKEYEEEENWCGLHDWEDGVCMNCGAIAKK